MEKTVIFSSIIVLFLSYLAFTYNIPYSAKETTASAQRSISANPEQNDIDEDNENKLSTYANPELGFRLKYPSDFLISEVSTSPQSRTVVFQKIQFAPETGAFLSVNSTRWNSVITFDELKKIMTDTVRDGPGISIQDIDTINISGIPGYKIVQNHSNSPYGKDAIAVFIGAVRDSTIYVLSSLSTDLESLQEIIDSFEFIR
jgi:PsbP-like protein